MCVRIAKRREVPLAPGSAAPLGWGLGRRRSPPRSAPPGAAPRGRWQEAPAAPSPAPGPPMEGGAGRKRGGAGAAGTREAATGPRSAWVAPSRGRGGAVPGPGVRAPQPGRGHFVRPRSGALAARPQPEGLHLSRRKWKKGQREAARLLPPPRSQRRGAAPHLTAPLQTHAPLRSSVSPAQRLLWEGEPRHPRALGHGAEPAAPRSCVSLLPVTSAHGRRATRDASRAAALPEGCPAAAEPGWGRAEKQPRGRGAASSPPPRGAGPALSPIALPPQR